MTSRSAAAAGRAFGVLVAMTLLSGCATPYNPYQVPKEDFLRFVRTVAIAPLYVDATVADRNVARSQIEPLVAKRLESGGFTVIGSNAMESLWRQAADDVGGIYDPVTGESDSELFETVESSVYHDLRVDHDVDAILYIGIVSQGFYTTGANVNYCGVEDDPVYWTGSQIGYTERTTVAYTLCLNISLYDMEERILYTDRHAIEPVSTYIRQTRDVRPIDERLRDRRRIESAVEETMSELPLM